VARDASRRRARDVIAGRLFCGARIICVFPRLYSSGFPFYRIIKSLSAETHTLSLSLSLSLSFSISLLSSICSPIPDIPGTHGMSLRSRGNARRCSTRCSPAAGEKGGGECKTEGAARTRGRENIEGLSNCKQQIPSGTGAHSPRSNVYIHTWRQASHTANEIRKQEDQLTSMRRYLSIIIPRIREDGLINYGLRALGGFSTWLQDREKLCTPVELMNLGVSVDLPERAQGAKGFSWGEKERSRWTVRQKGRNIERGRIQRQGYKVAWAKVARRSGCSIKGQRVYFRQRWYRVRTFLWYTRDRLRSSPLFLDVYVNIRLITDVIYS